MLDYVIVMIMVMMIEGYVFLNLQNFKVKIIYLVLLCLFVLMVQKFGNFRKLSHWKSLRYSIYYMHYRCCIYIQIYTLKYNKLYYIYIYSGYRCIVEYLVFSYVLLFIIPNNKDILLFNYPEILRFQLRRHMH